MIKIIVLLNHLGSKQTNIIKEIFLFYKANWSKFKYYEIKCKTTIRYHSKKIVCEIERKKTIIPKLHIKLNLLNSNFNANFNKKIIINEINNKILNRMQVYSLTGV